MEGFRRPNVHSNWHIDVPKQWRPPQSSFPEGLVSGVESTKLRTHCTKQSCQLRRSVYSQSQSRKPTPESPGAGAPPMVGKSSLENHFRKREMSRSDQAGVQALANLHSSTGSRLQVQGQRSPFEARRTIRIREEVAKFQERAAINLAHSDRSRNLRMDWQVPRKQRERLPKRNGSIFW
jgi:hypothetical protein